MNLVFLPIKYSTVLAKINNENYSWIYPNTKWKKIKLRDMKNNNFKVAEDLFLLEVKRLK